MIVEKNELSIESIIEETVHRVINSMFFRSTNSFNIDDVGDVVLPLLDKNGHKEPTLEILKKPTKILIDKGYEFLD